MIIRSPRSHFQMLWSSLTLVTSVANHNMLFKVIHVGGIYKISFLMLCLIQSFHIGTIKSCQKKVIQYNQENLLITEKMGVIKKINDDIMDIESSNEEE